MHLTVVNNKNHRTMKKLIQSTLFAACILTLSIGFTACRSEAPEKPAGETIVVGEAGIKFTASEEAFESAAPTRAAFAEPKEQTVDLGGGLTANVTLEEDNEEITRAPETLDGGGKYTIYVLDPATQKRITGKRKEMKGTFSNGNFTRTEGAITLAPGTYKFLCASEGFQPGGLSDGLGYTNGTNAMMGVTDNVTITAADRDIYIHFTMKHYTNRVRFKFRTYKQNISGIKVKYQTNNMNASYVEVLPDGTVSYFGGGGYTSEPFALPALGTTNTELGYAPYTVTTDYLYLIFTPGSGTEVVFTEGSIYGNSLVGKKIPLNNLFSGGAIYNKSYTATLSLTPTPVYLFSNGTVGMLEDKGSRTPIGVVVTHKKKGK